ncbi:ankyrin repeat-containing domain protein [Triangularia verruculosa]|uniref:Ankyrin repeat-containing domain protein n=1 Tax=Triangularia verruculosa TaxID=2587418 RepID=A0AAN6XDA9_9PEZI|nr:ankyrin repeat-containing domain protein [Triangularia verruculosa]
MESDSDDIAYTEGGWSMVDDDETMSDSSLAEPHIESASPPSVLGLPLDHSAQPETGPAHKILRSFLRRKLEDVGLPLRIPSPGPSPGPGAGDANQPSAAPSLFKCLAKSVLSADILQQWLFSTERRHFRLQIPRGLDNPFFFTSVVAAVAESQSSALVAAALAGPEFGVRNINCAEYMLVTLCFQLLAEPKIDLDSPELINELRSAFSGLHRGWRVEMLWALLQRLMGSGENKSRVIVLGFPLDSPALEAALPFIARLLEWTQNTERSIRVLLLLGPEALDFNGFETLHSLTVNMMDGRVNEGLHADVEAWSETLVHARPSLEHHREDLVSSCLRQHLCSPLLLFSALHALQYRPWISRGKWARIPETSLVTSLDSSPEKVPEPEKPSTADVIAILRYSRRPLTVAEFADALSTRELGSTKATRRDSKLLDIGQDLNRNLPGLVYIENDLVWYLQSHFPAFPAPASNSSHGLSAWLDMGPRAEMRLGFICLEYIVMWQELEGTTSPKGKNFAQEYAFLNYSATFWYQHFSNASRNGAPEKDVLRLLGQRPNIIPTWLNLQRAFDPSIGKLTDQMAATIESELNISSVSERFGVPLGAAVGVVNMAARLLPSLHGDVVSAITLSLWDHEKNRENRHSAVAWMKDTGCTLEASSVVRAFAHMPETTWDLLLAQEGCVQQHAKELLVAAVRQGNATTVHACLRHVKANAALLSDLSISTYHVGGCVWVLEAIQTEERLGLSDEQKKTLKEKLFPRAVAENSSDSVQNLLLSYPLQPSAHEYLALLLAATEAGQFGAVQCLVKAYRTTLPLSEASETITSETTALHCAAQHNFVNIAKTLLEDGFSVSTRDHVKDTPVHVAARYGHLEMLHLLTLATSGGSQVQAALEAENQANVIAIEVAIQSGHEAVVIELLHLTPRETVIGRDLIHIATRIGNMSILKHLLEYRGLDPNKRDKRELTALDIACMEGSFDAVEVLKEKGATVWENDDSVISPFDWLLDEAEDRSNAQRIGQLLLAATPKPDNKKLNRLLAKAARHGNDGLISLLLDAGADKNTADNRWRRTPLHESAFSGHEDAVRVLLLRGADPTLLDSWGDSALIDATNKGHLNVVSLLLERGERYPLNGVGFQLGRVLSGTKKALEVILKHQPELRSTDALTDCFRAAMRKDDTETVSILLGYDMDANTAVSQNKFASAIHECAFYGNVKMARVLLDHAGGVKHNMVNSQAGWYHTPLIAAVSWEYDELFYNAKYEKLMRFRLEKQKRMIDFLINKGGKPRIMGGAFGTMLNAAAAKGVPDLVTYVLEKTDFEAGDVDDQGRSAVHMACSAWNKRGAFTDTLKILIQRGGSDLLWTPDKLGRLPLHFACGGQSLDAINYLLSSSSQATDVNKPDGDGWTPLHWACRQWDSVLVRVLVSHKADVNARTTKEGWTPLDVAVFHNNPEFELELESDGAETGETDAKSRVQDPGVRRRAFCDSCGLRLYGIRRKCLQCSEYDLCFKCYDKVLKFHDPMHQFMESNTDAELSEKLAKRAEPDVVVESSSAILEDQSDLEYHGDSDSV